MADAKQVGARVNRETKVVKNPAGGEDLVPLDVTGDDGARYAPTLTLSQAKLVHAELSRVLEADGK